MSERTTTEYLPVLDHVYKNGKGKIGRIGEEQTAIIFNNRGYNTQLTLDHKPSQDVEIDMYFWLPKGTVYACEIKTNLKYEQSVIVDNEKMQKSESDIWFHLNKCDNTDYVVYDTEAMRDYVNTLSQDYFNRDNGCWYIPRDTVAVLPRPRTDIEEIIFRLGLTRK